MVEIDAAAAQRYAEAVGRWDGCMLQFGELGVSRPVPATLEALRSRLSAVFPPLLQQFPEEVDRGPRFVFREGWIVEVANTDKWGWSSHEFVADPDSPDARKAVAMLRDGMELAEADWFELKHTVWHAARTAERIGNQLLFMHLLQSDERGNEAERDYVGDVTADPIRSDKYGPRYESLKAALVALAEKRRDLEIDRLRRESEVMGLAAIGAGLIPLRAAAMLDDSVPNVVDDIRSLGSDTAIRAAQAMLEYAAHMRELAATHPIVLVLQHVTTRLLDQDSPFTFSQLQRAIRDAIKEVRSSIDRLASQARDEVIPGPPQGPAPHTVMSLVDAVTETSRLSVWKLPLFFDHALQRMPTDDRAYAQAVLAAALELTRERLLTRELVLTGIELGTSVIPAAKPVGLAISLAVALVRVAGTLEEYRELTALYHASMDPGFLALGDESHEPGDPDAIIFDLMGMFFGAYDLGRAL